MTNTVLEKKGSIHPSAVIHPSAEIGEGVIIGPNVVIGEGVKLGNGTRVIANAYIEFAEIGENCTISPFSTIGSEPVSYTHLDVYKRQHVHRLLAVM